MLEFKLLKKLVFAGLLFVLITSCSRSDEKYKFTYAKPESKGYSGERLDTLKAHLEKSGSSAMIIMVDGDVIFKWGAIRKKLLIHSIRKAMLNSLYGIAIARGQVDTSMTLRELKIDDIDPALSEKELDATVADLLKSRSGVYHDAAAVNNAMLVGRPERGTYEHGDYYYYNNWDFNTLGAILEKQTGESIYDLFEREIAQPLGMLDYRGEYCAIDGEAEGVKMPNTDGFYQFEKSKSNYPAYHFRMSARDLAIYGQLYLNNGKWNGQQIIPEDWIAASTQPYSIYDPNYKNAYGMLWKVRMPGAETQRNSFYHTGLGIHMLGIYPDLKLVIVHRVNTENDVAYQKADFYKMLRLLFHSKIK